MKKKMFVMILSSVLFGCSNNTYQELEEQLQIEESVTYNKQVKVIIQTNCVSCHSIGNVAGFRPLTDYYLLKDAILNTNLLDRIQKQNGEPGLMPQTGRMAQNQIDIILQWMADGLLEQ
ncbi:MULTISPECIES: hypothetical protein [Flavobacteriaceae]|uniref:Cytochrome c domain-containing protein n=1 Tax=Xanthomarina gelatinilytica TaxID=1137281 RepID=M7MKR4_9FLAO|nr:MULTISPECIES: hypothetical protein [Flavobacteriaceae]EMQ95480.1 hypothetical protein D778_02574 [Xanthomarina gelatinilytica]MDX1279225.1 cytochrome c [Oceanihabitans sediminis]